MTKKKIVWEKWIDPLNSNIDEVEYPGHNAPSYEDESPIEFLSSDLISTGLIRPPAPLLYTPLSPAETGNDSRDELLYGQARASSDPWDGQETREALFVQKLKEHSKD